MALVCDNEARRKSDVQVGIRDIQRPCKFGVKSVIDKNAVLKIA